MKTTKMLAILVLLLSLVVSARAELVAHYEFEGNAIDSAGSNHGTEVGDPTYGPGVLGQAINLDGNGDYVNCGNNPAFNITGQLTVTAWVSISSLTTAWMGIVTKGNSAWRLSNTDTERRFHFAACGGPPWIEVNGKTLVDFDEWHHVCGTYDGSMLRIYLDGVLDGSESTTEPIGINTMNVFIGANPESTGRYWDGLIDDVRIYNHALSEQDIQLLIGQEESPVNGFTYQGRLMDENAAAQGLYDFKFRLYDFVEGDIQQGDTIILDDLDLIDGYFTVELDFGDGVFNGDPRWLEIGVRPGNSGGSFTTLSPRQELTPAPYAFYALAPGGQTNGGTGGIGGSGTANYIPRFTGSSSIDNSVVYQSGDNVGIGTTSPDAKLHVNGLIKITDGSPGAGKVLTSDAAGLASWQTPTGGSGGPDGDWAVSGNDMYAMPSGNVGVGTTGPTAKLDINGQMRIRGGSPGGGKVLTSDAAGLASWQTPTGGSGGPDGDWTVSGNNMYSTPSGNVGIGTTSPEGKLHVLGTFTWSEPELIVESASGSMPDIEIKSSNGSVRIGEASGDMLFYTGGGGPTMEIKKSGNVGIGTGPLTGGPSYLLDVAGAANLIKDGTGAALHVNSDQALWYDGTYFSWGYGGQWNYFADPVVIGASNDMGYNLAVHGTAAKSQGGSSWATFSDARLKDINGEYEQGLFEVCQLTPVRYSYRQDNDQGLLAGGEAVGVIAQEVQTVIPEAVKENTDGYLMVNNDPIIWAMVNAIKELKSENDSLRQRLGALESRINRGQAAGLKEVEHEIR